MPNRYYEGPPTDHFDGSRFFCPGLPPADKSLLDILRWRLKEKRARWPETVAATTNLVPDSYVAGLRITHVGHASYLVQTAGQNILVDPVWAERTSPFRRLGPRRHNPPAIRLEDLPGITAVLVTHNHYDHMDLPTLQRLWAMHRPRMYAPLGNDTIIRSADPGIEVQTGDWWHRFALPGEIQLTIVPAHHWSSRGLGDRRMALWGGFIIEGPAGTVYCAGDTAYRDGALFPEIRKRFGPPLAAMLPIGAYAPRWFMQTQHADPEEAIAIAQDCGAQHALGVHWGTFQLTDEPAEEPAVRLAAAMEAAGLDRSRFHALLPGDVWQAP